MVIGYIQSCIDWLSPEIPSDLTVETAGTRFAVHKALLMSKCGRIRRMLSATTDIKKISYLLLSELPGGAEALELVAKYCYGLHPTISTYNVAMLICAAAYLEMEGEADECGLESLAQAYFSHVVLSNTANSIAVLHTCDDLLPLAEELQIVNRCIEKVVSEACSQLMYSSALEPDDQSGMEEWWVEKLSDVHVDFFQRIVSGMRSKGLQQQIISNALMHYALSSLERVTHKQIDQRSMVESIVSLLPPGKNGVPTSFLSGLLRTAIMVDASPQSKMELESRLAMQLDGATSHDLLILSFSHSADTLFDVEVVHRVVSNFLAFALEGEVDEWTDSRTDEDDVEGSEDSDKSSAMVKVSNLMDSYLAEIAPDTNLAVSKFILLAEVLPQKGRVLHDELYRAIDICLKAHPSAPEWERSKLCKLMDCQKLSQEACNHAAKNQRLPLHVVVQVLYFEQLRLRNDVQSGNGNGNESVDRGKSRCASEVMSKGLVNEINSSRDGYESVRVENRELRFEFCRMRMRMTDLENKCLRMQQISVRSRCPNNVFALISKNVRKLPCLFRDGIRILLFSKTRQHRHRNEQKPTFTHSTQFTLSSVSLNRKR